MSTEQKGFTLIEVLVSVAVGGVLLAGLVTAMFQTFGVTKQSSTMIIAAENVKFSAYWIGNDVRMAATTNLEDEAPAVGMLSLGWTNWYDENGELNPEDHHVEYALSGTNLVRDYDYGADVRTVGRYISNVQFYRQGQIIFATITSSPEGRPETAERQTYHLYLQPKEELVR